LILELRNPEIDDQMLAARAGLEAAKADLEARRIATAQPGSRPASELIASVQADFMKAPSCRLKPKAS
jgi:hypothetical protein